MKFAQAINVEHFGTKWKNLNDFKHLQLDVFVEQFGKNCRMTEQYSKTDRRSQNHASVSPSTCSIV